MTHRIKRSLSGLLALAMLASCGRPHRPAPEQTSGPTPAPAGTASVSPYGFTYTAPPAPQGADPQAPRIVEIDLNGAVLAAPGPIRVRVLTNAAVNTVVAQTMGRELGVPREAPGIFGADDQIPNIPFFLRNRTYGVRFVATTPDGRSANVTIPVTLR